MSEPWHFNAAILRVINHLTLRFLTLIKITRKQGVGSYYPLKLDDVFADPNFKKPKNALLLAFMKFKTL